MNNTNIETSLRRQYILTQVTGDKENIVCSYTLLFPMDWVAEILRLESDLVLHLPCYHPAMRGVFSRGGQIIPLFSSVDLLEISQSQSQSEKITVVRLNEKSVELQKIGLIIDKFIGIADSSELPDDLLKNYRYLDMILINSISMPDNIYQPIL
jgi:CheW-like domain